MPSYQAYNLNFHSVFPLPELFPATGEPEVVIQFGPVGAAGVEEGYIKCSRADRHEIVLTWGKVGSLLVRHGSEIILDPAPGADEAALRLLILGAGLGTLLHQRGLTVLHASAVAVDGRAIAFLADKGWGKSSTAAALCRRGHALITDDVLAVQFDADGQPQVPFAYPHMKLWPDTVSAIGYEPDSLPRIRPEVDKRSFCPGAEMPQAARLPLQAIYFLGDGPRLELVSLPPQLVFVELMRNLYLPGLGPLIYQALDTADLFRQCAQISQHITPRVIRRLNNLSSLDDIARLIEYDLGHGCSSDLGDPLTLPA